MSEPLISADENDKPDFRILRIFKKNTTRILPGAAPLKNAMLSTQKTALTNPNYFAIRMKKAFTMLPAG
ncbi:MAG TPA: hypothetical protein VK927_02565 [Adhaeribacter sp.]|nr:hypothetical protein [Adhaeribacter sp.]